MGDEWEDWEEEDEEEEWEVDPASTPHCQPAPRKEYPNLPKKKARKAQYGDRLRTLIKSYKSCLIVSIDNVGSKQMQDIRMALRGKAVLLMGRNSIIRRIIKEEMKNNPKLSVLLDLINGNIGMCFSNNDLAKCRKKILSFKVPAGAKPNTLAQSEVWIPAGSTGLDPGQTAFFQALNIGTKISRGAIEIINEVCLVEEGQMVTSSHVALLEKLNIRPFSYGMKVSMVYEDGSSYVASVLDLEEDILLKRFGATCALVAALSLQVGIPTKASLIHTLAHGFQRFEFC
jgi:large subunit ribosomal protein LP0